MKKLKTSIFILLMIFAFTSSIHAGTFTFSNATVPELGLTAVTNRLITTEYTKVGITASLNANGEVNDQVKIWTNYWYSEAQKSNVVIAVEGSGIVSGNNLNNAQGYVGDEVMVEFKNISIFNASYTINGYANYH